MNFNMGSIIYDFLADSPLFSDSEIQSGFSSLTDEKLTTILQEYRNHCLKNIKLLVSDVTETNSALKVLSTIEDIPYNLLKQSALYFDQFIIDDPLFPFTCKENETFSEFSKYLGHKKNGINRHSLAENVSLLKAITPMVAADFIKILPLSYTFEPPKNIPLNLPVNYYADELPKEILDFFKKKRILRSLKQMDDKWVVLPHLDYTPGLIVEFDGYRTGKVFLYHHFTMESLGEIAPNEYRIAMQLSEYPIDKDKWNAWVYQSINASAKAIFDKTYKENTIAAKLGATYLTDNQFISSLLTTNLPIKETVENSVSSQFLNINLPFLDNLDINKLMQIRINDADLFTNFRIELDKNLRELRAITNPNELKIAQENIVHELQTVQLPRISKKLSDLKCTFMLDAVIALGGLVGTVQTAGWSLLAASVAALSTYKSYREYKNSLKNNPAFLLWKTLKK